MIHREVDKTAAVTISIWILKFVVPIYSSDSIFSDVSDVTRFLLIFFRSFFNITPLSFLNVRNIYHMSYILYIENRNPLGMTQYFGRVNESGYISLT